MRARELGVVLLCLVCLQCGSQTPSAPTSGAPSSSAPGGSEPPAQPVPVLPPPFEPNVLVGAGDIATCDPNPEATARLLDAVGGTVIAIGDNAYPRGADAEYRECYEPTWGRHKARTRPSPGNHEYESPGAAPYFAYFGASAGPPGLGYYSFEVGSWLVLSLNSNANIEAQVQWLNNLLDRDTRRCTLAYWHHPFYSSGPNVRLPHIQKLWDVLYNHGADVVVTAHDHLYERFAPQDERGRLDPDRGIRQFVVGTGGAPLHRSRGIIPNSEVLLSAFGVLKVTLSADSYEWDFITVSGPADSGSGRCH